MKDAPLRSVLEQLKQQFGLHYEIAPELPELPLTLTVRDVKLRQAVALAVRQATLQRYMGVSIRSIPQQES